MSEHRCDHQFCPICIERVKADGGEIGATMNRGSGVAPSIDQIMRYEQGDLDNDEIVELFAVLVETGMAWRLQGHYGRTAMALIEAGLIGARSAGSRYDTHTIECVYCNHDVATSYDQVPSEHDEDFWTEEAKQHAPDCEWVRTRAHRMEDDE